MNNTLKDDTQHDKVEKIRPPRFVSFNMEIEPYSYRKALALEILNEINMNIFEFETIDMLLTLGKNDIIITLKRILCV